MTMTAAFDPGEKVKVYGYALFKAPKDGHVAYFNGHPANHVETVNGQAEIEMDGQTYLVHSKQCRRIA